MIDTGLIFALFALLVPCVIVVAIGLWRGRDQASLIAKQAQKAFFKQRTQELAAERDRGIINADEHAVLQLELERQLLAEVSDDTALSPRKKNVLNLLVIVALPISATVLYWQYGAWNDMQTADLQAKYLQSFAKPEAQRDPSLLPKLIESVERGVAKKPESGQHQVLAARLYMEAENYTAAAEAYAKALLQSPDSPELLALWAQADYLARDRQLTVASRQALKKSLTIDPRNTTSLGLLGLDAFISGRVLEAIDTWQQLLAVLPKGSSQANIIRDGLGRAIQVAKEQGLWDESLQPNAQAEVGAVVEALVSVSDEISIPEGGRLFVFAIGDDGMPMPLAVKSFAANALPMKLVLSDEDAMIPSRKLSAFKSVQLVARITKSGQVQPEPGDVEGRTEFISLEQAAEGTVTINVDSVLP